MKKGYIFCMYGEWYVGYHDEGTELFVTRNVVTTWAEALRWLIEDQKKAA